MAWKLQYYGEFLDIAGTPWRCEVLRDTDNPVLAEEVAFPASEPLRIEWPSIGFEEPVWGSSATLRLISDTDRKYIGMYTVTPGTIRLDVYRDGSPYWSGMLDPEFYEEPYESASGYEVELTFTDFGILDRLKFDLEGTPTLGEIVSEAVRRAGISCAAIDLSSYVALRLGDGSPFGDAGLAVRADNFTDEEGERSTLREALEGILQPLGVRIAQREGTVFLFDTQGLREAYGTDCPQARWSADSQTLGVDKVYNSVTVGFSPYARNTFVTEPVTFGADYSITDINTEPYWPGSETDDPQYWTYVAPDTDREYTFTIFISAQGSGASFDQSSPFPEYFHILPVYGSMEERSGVPWLFYSPGGPTWTGVAHGAEPSHWYYNTGRVFTLPRVYIPPVTDSAERSRFVLRVAQEMLVSALNDPFGDSDTDPFGDNQTSLEKYSAFVFLEAYINLYDSEEGGTALWHYDNRERLRGVYVWNSYYRDESCWKEGAAEHGDCWLEYYNPDDFSDNSGGVGGWKYNRHNVGAVGKDTTKPARASAQLRDADDGEFLPYPPEGGWLEIAIGADIAGYRHGSSHHITDTLTGGWVDDWNEYGVDSKLRWLLFGDTTVALARNNLLFDDADLEDIEYRGTLDPEAADDLSIDTVCGTCEGAPPTARGIYYDAGSGEQATEMSRGGVTARPEKLLIGSLYSQYAGRKTTLTGEAYIPGQLLLTERNQGDKLFVLTADSQDIRTGVSDIELREFGTDTYTEEE